MAKAKTQNSKLQKLNKAVKLLNQGNTIENVSEEVNLTVDEVTTLRESMILNLMEILDENVGAGAGDVIYEDNLLYIDAVLNSIY